MINIRNIKLIIEYDGTNYSGWQRQSNATCIQEAIEKAIFKITSENVEVFGASRTDKGVHAKAFIANFHTESSIIGSKFKMAINSKLPDDITIINSEEVDLQFHSRYNSKGKTYSYTILNREQKPAILRNYVYHVSKNIDVRAMQEGAKFLIGEHDFQSFRNLGSSAKTTIRTVKDIEIVSENNFIKFYISADGFLYNMARIIVGTLLDVGTGKLLPSDVKLILDSKDRKKAGRAVPGKGLCLEEVFY